MHFLLALRNVAFAYKVQGPLHDTFMFEYHFFPMLQAFTRPVLKRNHFSEANLLRFPHCLVALGPGTTYLCSTSDPTWENETSGVETHKWKLSQEPVLGQESLNCNLWIANEYSGLISFRIDWFDLFAVQGTLKSVLHHHSLKASILRHSAFSMVQLSHLYVTTAKTIALTRCTSVGKMMSLLLICCLD